MFRAIPRRFQAIVAPTQRIGIRGIRDATGNPWNSVIDLAGDDVATRPDTASATNHGRSTCASREDTRTSTEVDWHTFRIHHHPPNMSNERSRHDVDWIE